LLEEGSNDPVGGGTVKLTADHMTPHSLQSAANPDDPRQWRALCGRHQVMKKNYWDSATDKLNVYAIVQSTSRMDKRRIYEFLKDYFKDSTK
jgi:CobQ-like glutamine amidotransferase family enzyme